MANSCCSARLITLCRSLYSPICTTVLGDRHPRTAGAVRILKGCSFRSFAWCGGIRRYGGGPAYHEVVSLLSRCGQTMQQTNSAIVHFLALPQKDSAPVDIDIEMKYESTAVGVAYPARPRHMDNVGRQWYNGQMAFCTWLDSEQCTNKSNQIKSPSQGLQEYFNDGVDTKTIIDRIQGTDYPSQAEHDACKVTFARRIRETIRGR
jgi:hypothetical protein